MPNRRRAPIVLTRHALDRWAEYGGDPKALSPGCVRRRLLPALQRGLRFTAGAVRIEIDGLRVVLVPEPWGGWTAVTVLPPRRESA